MSKPLPTMDEVLNRRSLSNKPYSNCNTRIVDLRSLNIPDQATDTEYRQLYEAYIQSSSKDINARHLRDAIESIKYGIAPPVAFPTETVYGLGADATNEPAVAGIFAAKGRPSDNPLIVHVSSTEHLERVIDEPLPDIYKSLVDKFWPGPLTILLPVPIFSQFARNVYPGQRAIGFRMPSSKYARFFIAACDKPIAGPSANSSGKPSPTTAHHVKDDLDGKINFVLDGGACHVGVESTVVDGLCDPPVILRPGGVSRQELRELGGKWAMTINGFDTHESSHRIRTKHEQEQIDANGHAVESHAAPRAPGMKYKHYSPAARLILFTPTAVANNRVREQLDKLQKPEGKKGKTRVAFLDRTWGEYGGLDLTHIHTQVGGRTQEHRLIDLEPNIVGDLGLDLDAWSPFTHQTSVTETDDKVIFNLAAASRADGQNQSAGQEHDQKQSNGNGNGNGTISNGTSWNSNLNGTASTSNIPNGMHITNNTSNTDRRRTLSQLAQSLFAILRFCDALECDYIFAESVEYHDVPSDNGIGDNGWGEIGKGEGDAEQDGDRGEGGNGDVDGVVDGHGKVEAREREERRERGRGREIDEGVIDAVKDRLDKAAFERVEA